ncbi:glycosyltransferase [Neolewinella aurantiaca]|uniref:Glycosyltransferase n=1 Tax=Neolewinella aurantiaca TaxID=2602767 RepID=A0A5C7G1E8_9BACT|nr:glycosyltransferase [Neolewinella aurantiaca]TXF91702.1 glycosyltransferase [Neolewinella aurantiaca]
MSLIMLIILLLCVLGVLHTYVIYPLWVVSGSSGTAPGAGPQVQKTDNGHSSWPAVAVLMAAHNEETVLPQKLASLAAQDYPGELNFFIGSDCSTDATNQMLTEQADADARFCPSLFTTRQGKPGIINQLAASNQHPETIFIITDASVILRPDTISELVRPMLNDARIGVVDATMVQTGGTEEGIGQAEESYIHREVEIKRAEGRRWGAMVGPFGGCWAVRARAYTPVPENFLVDDFFLCMAAYEQGFLGLSSPRAVVEEAVGQSIQDEFRRKVRISSGNWQNLVRFRKLWWPFWKNPLAFAIFSHKILRWWTPFLLLIGLMAWVLFVVTLGPENNYWPGLLLLVLLGMILLLVGLDQALTLLNVHFRPGRFTSYFIAMNAALLVGFWRYLTGIKSNVWQPSQRH